jgi:hypothetical protein
MKTTKKMIPLNPPPALNEKPPNGPPQNVFDRQPPTTTGFLSVPASQTNIEECHRLCRHRILLQEELNWFTMLSMRIQRVAKGLAIVGLVLVQFPVFPLGPN